MVPTSSVHPSSAAAKIAAVSRGSIGKVDMRLPLKVNWSSCTTFKSMNMQLHFHNNSHRVSTKNTTHIQFDITLFSYFDHFSMKSRVLVKHDIAAAYHTKQVSSDCLSPASQW